MLPSGKVIAMPHPFAPLPAGHAFILALKLVGTAALARSLIKSKLALGD